MLTEYHKLCRYLWCLNNQNNDFSTTVFLDETTRRLDDLQLHHWRPRGSTPAVPKTNKVRIKVNIWGGISLRGLNEFAVIYT